jgi:citrate lyase subunit beta/citryl-CoA lyase
MDRRLRTLLFVPAVRPDWIAKALAHPVDAVVVDLEDAVAVAAKDVARDGARNRLSSIEPDAASIFLRVNAWGSPWCGPDLWAFGPVLGRIEAIVLPKIESAETVRHFAGLLTEVESSEGLPTGTTRVVPTIESAAGVLASPEIASSSSRVLTLLFGSADLSADIGVTATAEGEELIYARSRVVLAAAAAGLERPLDGPYLTLDDAEGLTGSAQTARRLGYGGKALIHPSQIEAVRAAFSPSEAELSWARAVDKAFTESESVGVGAIRLADGTFVDYPVAARAREMLRAVHQPLSAE